MAEGKDGGAMRREKLYGKSSGEKHVPAKEESHQGEGKKGSEGKSEKKDGEGESEKRVESGDKRKETHERHHKERRATHERQERERRDMHGNQRDEHRKMHERHEKEMKELDAKQDKELTGMDGTGQEGAADAQEGAAAPPAEGAGGPSTATSATACRRASPRWRDGLKGTGHGFLQIHEHGTRRRGQARSRHLLRAIPGVERAGKADTAIPMGTADLLHRARA